MSWTGFHRITGAAGLVLAAAAPAQAPKPTELHFGNEPWRLVVSATGMKPIEGVPSKPDRQVFTYHNDAELTVLSVIVENAHAPATLASCRDVFARRKQQGAAGLLPVNEVQAQRGEAATQEYDLVVPYQGKTITQHNVFSCRVRGTYYIDVHASKIDYQPAERDKVLALVDAVAIVD